MHFQLIIISAYDGGFIRMQPHICLYKHMCVCVYMNVKNIIMLQERNQILKSIHCIYPFI